MNDLILRDKVHQSSKRSVTSEAGTSVISSFSVIPIRWLFAVDTEMAFSFSFRSITHSSLRELYDTGFSSEIYRGIH